MCRIVGCVDFNGSVARDVIISMRDTMLSGGPDDAGIWISDNGKVGFGHRRLSIIDISELGHQPMVFENLSIVFNGEVYNYNEIRTELIALGYKFKSHSDTETVLKAYHHWGIDCVHRFRGMWAFGIYDSKTRKLILCRDRLGVKPLYYYLKNGLFIFASELKAFHQHPKFNKAINDSSLPYYFKYGYIPAPMSIFKDTFKLLPGHYLILDENCALEEKCYWKPEDYRARGLLERKEWLGKSDDFIVDELEDILDDSFALRMVSDVPVGMFLSGGIDSSLVTALLQKRSKQPLLTFTIGFYEEQNNEAVWAKKVAEHLKTSHTELYCTPKDAYELIFDLPTLYDEPFGDSSAIPTHLVSKLARQSVKVSLSADGGDELFGGYSNYAPAVALDKMIRKIPFGLRTHIAPLLLSRSAQRMSEYAHGLLPASRRVSNFREKYYKLINALEAKDVLEIFDISKSYWIDRELKNLLLNPIPPAIYEHVSDEQDLLNLMMMMDMKTYMVDDILTKVDRATMGVGLEGREPFLDNKIVEYALRMPSELKIKHGKTKYPLRQILYKYVPKELIERPKQGFGIPMHQWFRKELKELYEYYLSEERLAETGYFDYKFVRSQLDEFYAGRPISASKFWLILNFEMWREKWM